MRTHLPAPPAPGKGLCRVTRCPTGSRLARGSPALEGARAAATGSVQAEAPGPLALSRRPQLTHHPRSFSSRAAPERCWFFPLSVVCSSPPPTETQKREAKPPGQGEDGHVHALLTLLRREPSRPEPPTLPRMTSTSQRSPARSELGHRSRDSSGTTVRAKPQR